MPHCTSFYSWSVCRRQTARHGMIPVLDRWTSTPRQSWRDFQLQGTDTPERRAAHLQLHPSEYNIIAKLSVLLQLVILPLLRIISLFSAVNPGSAESSKGKPLGIAGTGYFYRPDALPVAQPTVSKHWRVSRSDCTGTKTNQLSAANTSVNGGTIIYINWQNCYQFWYFFLLANVSACCHCLIYSYQIWQNNSSQGRHDTRSTTIFQDNLVKLVGERLHSGFC